MAEGASAGPIWVGIVGSRDYGVCTCVKLPDEPHPESCPLLVAYLLMLKTVARLGRNYDLAGITSGGADGADSMARDVAELMEVPFKEFPVLKGPGTFAQRAFARNSQIVARADRLIAFFGPRVTRGTTDTIEKALAKGIPVHSLYRGHWYDGLPPDNSRS